MPFRLLGIRLEIGVTLAVITVFIVQELSECDNSFSSLSQYNYLLPDCCIRVTVLLEYFDNVAGPHLGPLVRWGPGQIAPVAPPTQTIQLYKYTKTCTFSSRKVWYAMIVRKRKYPGNSPSIKPCHIKK